MKKLYAVAIFLTAIALIISSCSSTKESTEKKEIHYSYTKHKIKYLDLKIGTGETPKIGDKVTVYTKVTTEDGIVLEDNFKDKKPISFILYDIDSENLEVIKGLAEGIMTMKKGGVRKLWVPPQMAFGNRKTGDIPSNSMLIVEVELIGIN